MKIYTYYENIGKEKQDKLIELWKISWSRQGYEPIVLNLQDAKRHSYFETFNSEMRKIFKEITNKEICVADPTATKLFRIFWMELVSIVYY